MTHGCPRPSARSGAITRNGTRSVGNDQMVLAARENDTLGSQGAHRDDAPAMQSRGGHFLVTAVADSPALSASSGAPVTARSPARENIRGASTSQPGVIVQLGATRAPDLTYNAAGRFGPAPQVDQTPARWAEPDAPRVARSTAATASPVATPNADARIVSAIEAPGSLPLETPSAASSLSGVAAPTATPASSAAAAPTPPALANPGFAAHGEIASNPFYPALAAALYVSAMVHRLQMGAADTIGGADGRVAPVAPVAPVSPVASDRDRPADDSRGGTSVLA